MSNVTNFNKEETEMISGEILKKTSTLALHWCNLQSIFYSHKFKFNVLDQYYYIHNIRIC